MSNIRVGKLREGKAIERYLEQTTVGTPAPPFSESLGNMLRSRYSCLTLMCSFLLLTVLFLYRHRSTLCCVRAVLPLCLIAKNCGAVGLFLSVTKSCPFPKSCFNPVDLPITASQITVVPQGLNTTSVCMFNPELSD